MSHVQESARRHTAAQETAHRAPTKLLLGGQWRDGSRGLSIPVTDPATETVLARVASATPEDGLAAVEVADAAGKEWARWAPRRRAEVLRRAFELMSEQSEWLSRLIVAENGKALPDARSEIAYAAEFFRWYSEEAVRNLGTVTT
jgi:succinate-semialdehyde dehydrogenase/glutarate-semialdehyde dehydrogenase